MENQKPLEIYAGDVVFEGIAAALADAMPLELDPHAELAIAEVPAAALLALASLPGAPPELAQLAADTGADTLCATSPVVPQVCAAYQAGCREFHQSLRGTPRLLLAALADRVEALRYSKLPVN